ncbi:hypothetical protein [uncultured Psychroserpens sp.]|uniref:hypothetical protein n=1 Tax=uncultured Psychroserpens sp. TaxID=255436 RepID=UPI00261BE1AC|nr:hypothetical protein [uncultured Psychroserpens sp.]
MKIKVLIIICIIFISCTSKKMIHDEQGFYGEYTYRAIKKSKINNVFKVKAERISKFNFNIDNTFLYDNTYFVESDIIIEDQTAWSKGNWYVKGDYIILNSEGITLKPEVIKTNKVNTIKINISTNDLVVDGIEEYGIKESQYKFFICKDKDECIELSGNTLQNYTNNSFYLKIKPIKEYVERYWIINTDELLSDFIFFPLDEYGLEINITLSENDFTYINFNKKSVKIKSKEKLIYEKLRYTKSR